MKLPLRSALTGCLILLACQAAVPASAAILTVTAVDGAGKPLADAVLVAEADGAAAPKQLRPAVIEQRGLKFLPLVTVVETGTTISFPNNDKVRHHIYSFSPAKKFDQKLYAGAAASTQLFDKAGTVVLGCNIHDRMVAYVRVVDSPYFAKSDDKGVARIDLPAGKYKLVAWHFNMSGGASEQAVAVKGEGASAAVRLALKPPADGDGY